MSQRNRSTYSTRKS